MRNFLIIALLTSIVSMASAKESQEPTFSQTPTGFLLANSKGPSLINTKAVPTLQCRSQCAPIISACRQQNGFEACIEVGIACYTDCAN